MLRFNFYILPAAAIAMGTAACGFHDLSDPPDPSGRSSQNLSPSTAVPQESGEGAELGDPPQVPPIDSDVLKESLADPTVLAKLRELALQMASGAGVSSPARMYVVAAADHQEVETVLSGATINDHAAVYAIVMTGGAFTADSHPPGVEAPQGDVMTITLEAATYRVTDVGIIHKEPDLSTVALATADLGAK